MTERGISEHATDHADAVEPIKIDPPSAYTVRMICRSRKPIPLHVRSAGWWKQYRLIDPAGVKERYRMQDAIDGGFIT